ncbi:EAL domain-containing protein [Dactylosporangium sp. NBC_01737]|uniref:putative bifunctional diguanylate cyclase/phosphodiesterase n=1 Tax=Dactylosporangium sp. NBC_01737 TaxID=2975959 RepID=UPI002E1646A2|nr:EAL domain-containing protein [Dactylosporangium sp. NBC_01737]
MRRWTATLYALGGVYGLALAGILAAVATGAAPIHAPAGAGALASGAVGLFGAVCAARHGGLDERTRRSWWFMALGYALALSVPCVFTVTGPRPFPSPGDVPHLAFVLVLLFAVQTFPLHAATRNERHKHLLDAATVLAGAAMMMWYFVVGPYILAKGASVGTVVAAAAYPAADLALLFGIAKVLLRGADPASRRPLGIVAAGMVVFTVGDGYLGYMQAHADHVERTAWQFVCWTTAHFLLAVAAVEQNRQAAAEQNRQAAVEQNRQAGAEQDRQAAAGQDRQASRRGDERPGSRVTGRGLAGKLPYAGIGVGYALMILAAVRQEQAYPWAGLVVGAFGITGLVVLRQVLVQQESREMAVTDGLTGLANRSRVHEVLARALARGERSGRSTAVLLIDMNGFKQVNDSLGHEAGDRLLVEFGEMMRRSVLGGDLVGRLGGDEFAVVLHDIGRVDHAVAVAKRIVLATQQPIPFGDQTLRASASIGVAVGGPGECTTDELLHRADLAMYQAKRRTGGTRWHCWDRSLTDEAELSLEQELRGAIAEGQLRLLYQPIVALPSRELTGVEALVRWEHPRHGLLLPEQFVPLAERAELIEDLGRWVLEQACAQAKAWQRRVPSLQLNVNISPRQLDNQGFTGQVLEILDRAGFFAGHLVLEVPESAVIGEADPIAQLEALSTAGIRIALDDFGTGYSSLRYLTRLPVDALKLDSCFVAELDGTSKGSAVAQAVLRLGQMLHLDTVAEGVEGEAQARELTLLGCEKAQGRYFSGPVLAGDLERQLPAGTVAG